MKFRNKLKDEKGMSPIATILMLIIAALVVIIVTFGIMTIIRNLRNSATQEEAAYNSFGASAEENSGSKKEEKKEQKQEESIVGKYVAYIPKQGTYMVEEKYSGNEYNKNEFKTEAMAWRIWSIQGSKLLLIADSPTTEGTLVLDGVVGYNNGVKIINDICENCYSNNELGGVARSVNIEDIENALNKNTWKPEDSSVTIQNTMLNTYKGSIKYTENRKYPYIYQYEEYSNIDGQAYTKGQGLARSKQEILYSGEIYKTYEANSYIEPTRTYWSNPVEFTTQNFSDQLQYYLLYKTLNGKTDLTAYWLSSRSVNLTEKVPEFGITCTGKGIVDSYTLYNPESTVAKQNIVGYKIRPMIEIDLRKVNIDTKSTDGSKPDTAYGIGAK